MNELALTLTDISPQTRSEIYDKCPPSSLYCLCCVSTMLRDELDPSIKANELAKYALSRTDELLKFTEDYGKKIKRLNVVLDNVQPDSLDNILQRSWCTNLTSKAIEECLVKLCEAIRNCPQLSSLFLKNELQFHGDFNALYKAAHSECLSNLPHLKQLGLEDHAQIFGPRYTTSSNISALNIKPLEKLQKIILNRVDLDDFHLQQLKKLPDHIELQLEIHCPSKIPESIIEALKSKTNCIVAWNLSVSHKRFPLENLKLLQNMKCRQTVTMLCIDKYVPDEGIELLKPFKSVCLQLLPDPYLYPASSKKTEHIEALIKNELPGMNITIEKVQE